MEETLKSTKTKTKTQKRFVARLVANKITSHVVTSSGIKVDKDFKKSSKQKTAPEHEAHVHELLRLAQKSIEDAIIAAAHDVSEHPASSPTEVEQPMFVEAVVDMAMQDNAPKSTQATNKKDIATKTTSVRIPTPIDGVAVSESVLQVSKEHFSLADILCKQACESCGTEYTEDMRNEVQLALRTHAWGVAGQIPKKELHGASLEEKFSMLASDYVRLRGVCRETLIAEIMHANKFYPSQGSKEHIYSVLSDVCSKKVLDKKCSPALEKLIAEVERKYFSISPGSMVCRFHEEVVRAMYAEKGQKIEESIFKTPIKNAIKRTKQGVFKKIFTRAQEEKKGVSQFVLPEHIQLRFY